MYGYVCVCGLSLQFFVLYIYLKFETLQIIDDKCMCVKLVIFVLI